VASCCDPIDYRRLFSRKSAARDLRRYRQHGLSGTSLELVGLAGDVHDLSVLDVGGGIGAIELELLGAGAARATNVELSGGYEEAAGELIAERGLEGRVERRVGDFVTAEVDPHDVVVLHRVVCCYPDVDALVGTAADHTQRTLLLTYPQERMWMRMGLRAARCEDRGGRRSARPSARASRAPRLALGVGGLRALKA